MAPKSHQIMRIGFKRHFCGMKHIIKKYICTYLMCTARVVVSLCIRLTCKEKWMVSHCIHTFQVLVHSVNYRQTSNISRILVGDIIVDHSDVVGPSHVGAAPTTSAFSTQHLASMDWTKTTAGRGGEHLSFGIRCLILEVLFATYIKNQTKLFINSLWHNNALRRCSSKSTLD